jgi:hypothetical protein
MKSTPNSNDWQQFNWKKLYMEAQQNVFSSVVEKTPISSSPSVSPPVPLKTVVAPNPECLGYKYKLGKEGFKRSGYTRTELTLIDLDRRLNINLKFSPNFAMGTCGACELSNLSGWFDNNEVAKQNFVISVLPLLDITYYGIASTSQRKAVNTPLSILMDIGMKEVYKSPNRLHGPNELHLMVLDPQELNQKGIRKYCYTEPGSNVWLPLWLKDLSNEEKNRHFDEWNGANSELIRKQLEEASTLLMTERLRPIHEFASYVRYYFQYKGSPQSYNPLNAEQLKAIDDLMAQYNIKVK